MSTSPILVVGATGTVGSELVNQLEQAGHRVRALVRDRAKAERFGGRIEAIVGDLSRPDTLDAAFAGAGSAFVLAPPVPDLEQLEANAFDAAKAAGVERLVYLSNFGAGTFPGGIWQWHGASEKRVRELGISWTILRPARFMPDTPFPWSLANELGTLSEPTGNGQITMVDPRDIAAVAVKALTTSGHDEKTYELTTTESLTGTQLAEKLSAAMGRPIKFVDAPPSTVRASMLKFGIPEFIADTVLQYFETVREGRWYTTSAIPDVLGRPARTFDAWLRERGSARA